MPTHWTNERTNDLTMIVIRVLCDREPFAHSSRYSADIQTTTTMHTQNTTTTKTHWQRWLKIDWTRTEWLILNASRSDIDGVQIVYFAFQSMEFVFDIVLMRMLEIQSLAFSNAHKMNQAEWSNGNDDNDNDVFDDDDEDDNNNNSERSKYAKPLSEEERHTRYKIQQQQQPHQHSNKKETHENIWYRFIYMYEAIVYELALYFFLSWLGLGAVCMCSNHSEIGLWIWTVETKYWVRVLNLIAFITYRRSCYCWQRSLSSVFQCFSLSVRYSYQQYFVVVVVVVSVSVSHCRRRS